jgi:hypothetical protein
MQTGHLVAKKVEAEETRWPLAHTLFFIRHDLSDIRYNPCAQHCSRVSSLFLGAPYATTAIYRICVMSSVTRHLSDLWSTILATCNLYQHSVLLPIFDTCFFFLASSGKTLTQRRIIH